MPKLTDDQKQAYLRDPKRCPWCGNDNHILLRYYWSESEPTDKLAECFKCGHKWLYTLTDVKEGGE